MFRPLSSYSYIIYSFFTAFLALCWIAFWSLVFFSKNLCCFLSYYLPWNFSLKKLVHFLLNFYDSCFWPFEYNAAVCVVTLWWTTPRLAACFKSSSITVVWVLDVTTLKNLPPFGLVYSICAWKGIYLRLYMSTFSLCKS